MAPGMGRVARVFGIQSREPRPCAESAPPRGLADAAEPHGLNTEREVVPARRT